MRDVTVRKQMYNKHIKDKVDLIQHNFFFIPRIEEIVPYWQVILSNVIFIIFRSF